MREHRARELRIVIVHPFLSLCLCCTVCCAVCCAVLCAVCILHCDDRIVICSDQLRVTTSDHPVLLSESSYVSRSDREAAVKHLFETQNVPALYLAKSAVLAAFASAKATACVVDMGAGGSVVTAVHDGYYLSQSVMRNPIGGEVMTGCMEASLKKQGSVIRPVYAFKRKARNGSAKDDAGNKSIAPGGDADFDVEELSFPGTSESYRRFCVANVVRDAKEAVLRVGDAAFDEVTSATVPTMSYELPDGETIEVGAERFRVAETLFEPGLVSSYGLERFDAAAAAKAENDENAAGSALPTSKKGSAKLFLGDAKLDPSSLKGIHSMVIESISRCDPDVRKDLFGGVLLTGGNSVIPNMRERLERELMALGPQNSKIKVLAQQAQLERRFSAWIGGSILASLGSFQQMWFSKQEYEEHGAQYIHRKAP